MKRSIAALFVAVALAASAGPARALDKNSLVISSQLLQSIANLTLTTPWKCERYNHVACTTADLNNGSYKQILIFSAGFQDADRATFFNEFEHIIDSAVGSAAGNVWTVQKKTQLLFVAYYTGGGALGTPASSFGAQVMVHPIRGYGLTLRQDDVYTKINSMKAGEIPQLRPFAAGVLFNTTQNPVTANASPPSFVDKPFGVAKFTLHDAEQSPYVVTHELAHAGLNYVDEYTEKGLENTNIKSFDVLTPLVQLDGTWGGFVAAISNFFGVYSVQISEVLANNGNDNVTTSRYPSTVSTPGYNGDDYTYQSGFFFGLGTWHMPGANLMDDNNVTRGGDDGFAYAHSPAQQRVIDLAFGSSGSHVRPNDRLLNAGPVNGWPLSFGSTTHVMLRDADMYHQFQPTQSYSVQVGWYERNWKTCWAAFIPYPCYDSVWTTAQKTVGKSKRSINLQMSAAYGLISLAQNLLCELGITEINMSGGGKFELCQQDINSITQAFLPTVVFNIPYRDLDVPASQWLTTYWWRFSTNNGSIQSGWTGWSSFYRSL